MAQLPPHPEPVQRSLVRDAQANRVGSGGVGHQDRGLIRLEHNIMFVICGPLC